MSYIIVSIGLLVPAMFLRAWVLLNLWIWFVLPLGAPRINLTNAIGLALLASFLHPHTVSDKEKSLEQAAKEIAAIFFYPLFTLFLGWIVQAFIS